MVVTHVAVEADRLIRLGYRVLRLNGATKRPSVSPGEFGRAHPEYTSPADSFKSKHGLAILCGPSPRFPGEDLVCLDLDGGFDLEAHVPGLPPTITSKSGAHRWYRVPSGTFRNRNDWFRTRTEESTAALDLKTDGGYAREYPSEGAEWDAPGGPAEDRDPALMPATCIAVLQAARGLDPRSNSSRSLAVQAEVLATTAPPAIAGENGSGALWGVALDLVRGLGMAIPDAMAVLRTHYSPRCQPPWSEAELLHKCTDAFEKAEVPFGYLVQPSEGYLLNIKGSIQPLFENYLRFVRCRYPELKWDSVQLAVHQTGQGLVNIEELIPRVRCAINIAFRLDPTHATVAHALEAVAQERPFHSVRDALAALPRWDGRPRLDTWLIRALGAADTPYVRAVSRAWLVSAVARAFEPGCKADHMLVLEGAQGVGKSTALALVGGAGYRDLVFNAHDKDAMQDLRGAWVVEYAELSGLNKRDDEWLKAHISRAADAYRRSYGRDSVAHPRTCVLAGTTNPSGDGRYLRDQENRRLWPVACSAPARTVSVRLGALRAERDQLLAEALAAYRSGAIWHLDQEVGQTAEQDARREQDPLEASIPLVVDAESRTVDIRLLRANPILARDLDGSPAVQGRRIGRVLRQLGFSPPKNRASTVWKRD